MASSLPYSLCSSNLCFCKHKVLKYPKVRSQSFKDEGNFSISSYLQEKGKSENVVDANLYVLRERIAVVKKKGSSECCRVNNGWNYQSGYDYKRKRDAMLWESLELMGVVSGSFGAGFSQWFSFNLPCFRSSSFEYVS